MLWPPCGLFWWGKLAGFGPEYSIWVLAFWEPIMWCLEPNLVSYKTLIQRGQKCSTGVQKYLVRRRLLTPPKPPAPSDPSYNQFNPLVIIWLTGSPKTTQKCQKQSKITRKGRTLDRNLQLDPDAISTTVAGTGRGAFCKINSLKHVPSLYQYWWT